MIKRRTRRKYVTKILKSHEEVVFKKLVHNLVTCILRIITLSSCRKFDSLLAAQIFPQLVAVSK